MERHIIPISGKDSLATALIQTARHPELEYEYFFNDIGTELPETYAWLDLVEKQTGWHIRRVGKDLHETIRKRNVLPSGQMRFCTTETKIKPMQAFFKSPQTFIYYGLRADENRVGLRPSDTFIPVYPLQELGITLQGVYAILNAKDLTPPSFFWNALYYRVCELAGENYREIENLPDWEQNVLFAGRSRGNCYFCFYMRQYEWLWLLETHPKLFWKASRIERTTGGKDYSWREEYFIEDKIIRDRDRILTKRAEAVLKQIRRRLNKQLFDEVLDNEIALTSCGLLCGK